MNIFQPLPTPDAWEQLQTTRQQAGVAPHFCDLLAAIDLGWEIEEPVYLRPKFGETGHPAFFFIITNSAGRLALLVVPSTSEVERFVKSEGLAIEIQFVKQ